MQSVVIFWQFCLTKKNLIFCEITSSFNLTDSNLLTFFARALLAGPRFILLFPFVRVSTLDLLTLRPIASSAALNHIIYSFASFALFILFDHFWPCFNTNLPTQHWQSDHSNLLLSIQPCQPFFANQI